MSLLSNQSTDGNQIKENNSNSYRDSLQSFNQMNNLKSSIKKSREGLNSIENININNSSHYSIKSSSKQNHKNSFSKISNNGANQNEKSRQIQSNDFLNNSRNTNKSSFLKNSRTSYHQASILQPELNSSKQLRYNKYSQNYLHNKFIPSYPQSINQVQYDQQSSKIPSNAFSKGVLIQDNQLINSHSINNGSHYVSRISSKPQYKNASNINEYHRTNNITSHIQGNQKNQNTISRQSYRTFKNNDNNSKNIINRQSREKISNHSINNSQPYKTFSQYQPKSYNINSQNPIKSTKNYVPNYIVNMKDFKKDDNYLRNHQHINGQFLTQDLKLGYKLTARSFDPQYINHGLQLLFQQYGASNKSSFNNNNEQLMIDINGMQRIMNDMYFNLGVNMKASKQQVLDYMKRMQKYNSACKDGKINKFQMKKVVNSTHIIYDQILILDNMLGQIKQQQRR